MLPGGMRVIRGDGGDKGEKGIRVIKGMRGIRGIRGIRGDKGDKKVDKKLASNFRVHSRGDFGTPPQEKGDI